MPEKYKRSKHLNAKQRYKFLTLRLPIEEHEQIKQVVASKEFPSINQAIITYITWGLETQCQNSNV